MGYKNDQFFGVNADERNVLAGGSRVRGRTVKTNSDFGGLRPFPDNKVRTTYRDSDGTLQFENTVLKKGYIRSLLTKAQTSATTSTSFPILRCDFQFNPDRLVQSVPMRTNLVNVFQQSPEQLTQPLAGDVSFGFNLVFDRTYTYNNSSDEQLDPDLQGSYNEKNIGVLHDLRMLYSIIGQGISKDFVEASVASATSQAQQIASIEVLDSTNDADKEFALSDRFGESASAFFNSNIGNSAFLVPTPVRVVFSGLYVVDGFVTNATTTFTKFSSSYVPIQCSVGLTMQALYIGFATDRTFLVENLENATKALEESLAASRQLRIDTTNAFVEAVPKLEVKFNVEGANLGTWRQFAESPTGSTKYAGENSIGYYMFEPNITDEEQKANFSRYAKLKAIPRTEIATSDGRPSTSGPNLVNADDEIRAIFTNNEASPPTVQISIEARMYGPTITPPNVFIPNYTEEAAESLLISTFYTTWDVTSLEGWETLKKGIDTPWTYQQRNETFTRAYLKTLLDDNPDYNFYLRVDSNVSVSVGGSTPISRSYPTVWASPSTAIGQLDESVSIQTSRPS